MIFGLAAPAVDIFVKHAGVADRQVRVDEPRVGLLRADFDASDDPLDAAPAFGPIEELLEAAELAVRLRRSLEARLRAGIIETVGPTLVENFGTAIVAVGAQQDLGVWPVGADRPQQAAQEGADLLAPRLAGRSIVAMKWPSPSNTTIG